MPTTSITLLAFLLLIQPAGSNEYSLADYERVSKIDIHTHFSSVQPIGLEAARTGRFRLFGIEVEKGNWEDVRQQHEIARTLHRAHPDFIAFAGTFSMEGWDDPGWKDRVLKWLESCRAEGAVACKIWKNIGMEFRSRSGQLIMVDDPGLKPVFDFLESQRIPLFAHLAEPRNCWLPLDQMTTNNDRAYFQKNPKYHMYLHPEMPSYESQLAARDHMLEQHLHLRLIGCHLASIEWSVAELARWLERFPQAVVEMSARISQLQVQTIADREKVRQFMIRYQDRILYGTDTNLGSNSDPTRRTADLDRMWRDDWRYLVSDEWMESSKVNGKFQGLKLPRPVIDKIYRENALKVLPGVFKQ
jgi:hypothetical protein